MSDARDPRADDTNFIPPDGPAPETLADDPGAATIGEDVADRGGDHGRESGRARADGRRDAGRALARRGRHARQARFGRLDDGSGERTDGTGDLGDGRLPGLGGRRDHGRSRRGAWPRDRPAPSPGRAGRAGLRDHRGDRPRRHGCRVPGPARPARSSGRAEDDPGRGACLERPDRPVPHRGPRRRPDPAPGDRPDPRGRRSRWVAVLLAGIRAGGQPRPIHRRQAAGPAGGGDDGDGAVPVDGRGPRPGHHPPRLEAGQRPADPRRQAQDHRLRPGQADAGGLAADQHRRDHGHPLVHGPRTGVGPFPRHRSPERPVRAGGDPLRDARRPPALPGGDDPGDAGPGPNPGAGPARQAPAQSADGPGDDLPEGPPEGSRPALPRRRGHGRGPPPLPRRRADPRPPRRHPGTIVEMVPAQPARRRTGRGRRAPGHRRHGRLGGIRRVPEEAQR